MPGTSKIIPAIPTSGPLATPQAKGVLLLVLAIVIWGANWPVMKAGLQHISPVWFAAVRFAAGAACLFALQLATGSLRVPQRRDLPLILSVGLLQMLTFTVLGAMAMTQVPAGRSAVLAYTTPLWVTPLAVSFFGERLSRRQLAGTLLGGIGVGVLFNPLTLDWHDSALLKANLMLIAASLCWALCILHMRHSRPAASAYQLAPWQMLTATVPLLGLAYALEGPFTGDGSATLWQIMLFMGPLATAFCFCAVNAASMWLSSTSMSTAMLGVPVVGLLMSVAFMGEQLTWPLLAGVLAILAGIVVVTCGRNSG
ncbi:DMT family transporter [Pseudomonas sp. DTU_2021_1001937_2_SI_NGA_ILE_001]|uniref:DMT family transporter n=1 Tax=Pseudomonas sp. DTU_2021_1001937_2_SI_NGA_ILE_001 TaxID=3077589 RepID=UPI0028FC31B6|nr:DMT family transporter [Pseudomonas sp. DTU_2021_1001937_2_SI_NGA_ILE_001]WNW09935.1 DMT family transporter [Pseudomonas sp. DTU_2021_1001937_2_SI_NGA_ILE_001]